MDVRGVGKILKVICNISFLFFFFFFDDMPLMECFRVGYTVVSLSAPE